MASQPTKMTEPIRFGEDLELDVSARRLRRGGHTLKLERIPLEVLVLLLERAGEIVSRDEIVAKVWGRSVFLDTDNSIRGAVRKIRQVLKDDPDHPRFIQTVTGQGYRFVAPVKQSPEEETGRSLLEREHENWLLLGLLVVALLAISLFYSKIWRRYGSGNNIHSLAVLPLRNLSGDPNQDYFADGMTDELITSLAKIRSLRVTSHTSTIQFRNTEVPISEIAKRLQVDTVLEGAVVRFGDRVRITVQLIDARSDRHLWAENYERDLQDVLGLQGEVARQVAKEVGISLTTSELAGFANNQIVDPGAQEEYLRGVFYWNRWDCDGFKKGLEYFERSVEKDSSFAPAYVGVAQSYFTLADFGCLSQDEALPKSKAAALKALELDHNLGAAHAWLGNHAFYYDWDWPRAEREFKLAVEENPNYLPAHIAYAVFLVSMGRREQGFAEMNIARQLDPTSLATNMVATYLFYLTGQFDQAIDQGRKTVELYPELPAAYIWLAPSYEMKGMGDQAFAAHLKADRAWGATAEQLSAIRTAYEKNGIRGYWRYELEVEKARGEDQVPEKACWMAQIYAHMGERARTLEYLNRALQSHCSDLPTLNVDPLYNTVREEPAFKELIVRLRM